MLKNFTGCSRMPCMLQDMALDAQGSYSMQLQDAVDAIGHGSRCPRVLLDAALGCCGCYRIWLQNLDVQDRLDACSRMPWMLYRIWLQNLDVQDLLDACSRMPWMLLDMALDIQGFYWVLKDELGALGCSGCYRIWLQMFKDFTGCSRISWVLWDGTG